MALRIIYTLFIGLLLATFVGVGIAAFYTGPKFPEPPAILKYCSSEITQDASKYTQFRQQAEKHDKEVKVYEAKAQTYNRNVSIISLVAAILILITSLTLLRKISLIADGLLLGGVLAAMYSIIRGFGTDDNMFRFVVVSVGLAISLLLGYLKFIKQNTRTDRKDKRQWYE